MLCFVGKGKKFECSKEGVKSYQLHLVDVSEQFDFRVRFEGVLHGKNSLESFILEASTERLRKGFMRYLGQKVMLECYVGRNYLNCLSIQVVFQGFEFITRSYFSHVQF